MDGQILVFPPRGEKNYAALTALLDEAPSPPAGLLLARFKAEDVFHLKSFAPVEEQVLDWRYPVRVLSTKNMVEMHGHDYMLIRNRVKQTKKYPLEVAPLSLAHIPEIENLSYRWANKQAEKPEELIDLVNPYRETLRLLKHKTLKLDGLVFIVEGQIQATTMWDVSNPYSKTANLFMNLCNINYRGLSEFSIKATAEKLLAKGVNLLNLGGSETSGLDHYKNKFVPQFSVELYSLKATANMGSFSIKEPVVVKQLQVA